MERQTEKDAYWYSCGKVKVCVCVCMNASLVKATEFSCERNIIASFPYFLFQFLSLIKNSQTPKWQNLRNPSGSLLNYD